MNLDFFFLLLACCWPSKPYNWNVNFGCLYPSMSQNGIVQLLTAQFSSARSNNLLQALKSTQAIFTRSVQNDCSHLLLKQLEKTSTYLNGLSTFKQYHCILIGTLWHSEYDLLAVTLLSAKLKTNSEVTVE